MLDTAGLEEKIGSAIDLAEKNGLELTQRYLSLALRSLSSSGE